MLKIIFMGTPKFSVPILQALDEKYDVIAVVTQPDRPVGRKRIMTPSPVKEYAVSHNIPVYQPEHIKEEYDNLINLNSDLIVTAAYGQFVGMKLLNSPKYRAINCHGSLLPKYRGGSPIQTAIKNGEKETGISIMYMEQKMDAGDILSVKKVPIDIYDTADSLFDKMSLAARDLLMETIPLLIENKINPIKQNEEEATFAYNITREEELLDFSKSTIEVYNHIRAFYSSPLTYFIFNNEEIKVSKAKLIDNTQPFNINKKIDNLVIFNKNHLAVLCGDNTYLELLELKPWGKSFQKASDFINGYLAKTK